LAILNRIQYILKLNKMIGRTVCVFLWGDWVAALWAIVAFLLSLFTFFGCDYVRLNFDAINDSGVYFQQPSWFGLGLSYHQNFDENKNSIIWEHNATCYNYDDLAISMFRSTSLSNAFQFTAIATVMNAILILLICVVICSKRQCYVGRILNCSASLASTLLQIFAYLSIFSASNGGVCDPSTYGNNWYTKFSPFRYPNTAYMKFFTECTTGATSKIALGSIVCQSLTLLWMCINLFILLRTNASTEEKEKEEDIVKKKYADDIPQYISKDIEGHDEIISDVEDAIRSKSSLDSPKSITKNEPINAAMDDQEIQNDEEIAAMDDHKEEESSIRNEEVIMEEGSIESLKDNGDVSEVDEIDTTAAETVPLTVASADEEASNVTGTNTQNNQSIANDDVDDGNLTTEAGNRLLKELSFFGI